MTAIQAVFVRGHEERTQPKLHVVFRIDIQAHVRSWSMWRRYSEFTDLHVELSKVTGAPPPAPLPPKHSFSWRRTRNDPAILEERRAGLEAYLRAIVAAKEERWRECYAFKEFLGVPVGRQHADGTSGPADFSSATWLDEHLELQARVRDVRADVNRRDALADRADVAGAHTANVQAKKRLAGVLSRVGRLAEGLNALARASMNEGELQRRTDMVGRLQDDCEKLGKILTVARQTSRRATIGAVPSAAAANPAPESDRSALLGTGPSWAAKPVTRVFGQKPQETEETRPLDDTGLLHMQKDKMSEQDAQLSQLTTILRRQRQLGEAINTEIQEQIDLLDGLTDDVDRTGRKLTNAKKQLNRLG